LIGIEDVASRKEVNGAASESVRWEEHLDWTHASPFYVYDARDMPVLVVGKDPVRMHIGEHHDAALRYDERS
jgi:hypothetical protein